MSVKMLVEAYQYEPILVSHNTNYQLRMTSTEFVVV